MKHDTWMLSERGASHALPVAPFISTIMVAMILVSCQSAKNTAQPPLKTEVLYASKPNLKHTDPPGKPTPPPIRHQPPESMASRCIRPLARALSAIGRVPALPAGLLLGAMGGNGEIMGSTAEGVFKEPLP